MLKMMVLPIVLSLSLLSTPAKANGMLDLSGNLGISHLMLEVGDSFTGLGFDVAIGIPISTVIVPELMLGLTKTTLYQGVSLTNLMVMGGVRLNLPISPLVELYAYAHGGLTSISLSKNSQSSESITNFGINVGGGVHYMFLDTVGIGLSAGPAFAFTKYYQLGRLTFIRANLNTIVRL